MGKPPTGLIQGKYCVMGGGGVGAECVLALYSVTDFCHLVSQEDL